MKNVIIMMLMVVIVLLCGEAVYATTVSTPELPTSYKIFTGIFGAFFVFGVLLYKYEFIGSSSDLEDKQENR